LIITTNTSANFPEHHLQRQKVENRRQQADRDGQIDVDGTLLEDLLSVGLYTEIGNLVSIL
jgi:hypothetical protein